MACPIYDLSAAVPAGAGSVGIAGRSAYQAPNGCDVRHREEIAVFRSVVAAMAFAFLFAIPGRAEDNSRPPLDHARPWFTRNGAPICQTKEDLANLRDNAVL